MHKFQVGDKVIVRKPADGKWELVSWIYSYNKYVGKSARIVKIWKELGCVRLDIDEKCVFSTHWIEPVNEEILLEDDDLLDFISEYRKG